MAPFDFQHSELTKPQEIRLFHLKPGGFHDPISATLSVACLGDCPKYEALSYVWGDPDVCFDITLDGQALPVRMNLWAALRRRRSQARFDSQLHGLLTTIDLVRGLHKERVLWVDALCIDQHNPTEKTYQVGLMTEIYRNTWRCLAWLGEFEGDAVLKPGMSLQSYRGSGVTMDRKHAQMAFQFMDKLSKLSADGHFTIETKNVRPGWVSVTQPEITAVQRLVSLKWFTRIWTAQEFVLSPRVELVLGAIKSEEALELLVSKPEQDMWKHDRLYGRCCEDVAATLPDFPALFLYFFDRMPSLRRIKKLIPLDLTYAINRFRSRACEDPRDKIFALLGFTHPLAKQLVDYTLDKREIYIQSVRYEIESTSSLKVLMRLPERSRDMSLPSWVPDLGATIWDEPGPNSYTKEMKYIVDSSPLFTAGMQRRMELGVRREDELQLGGRRVDSIRRICNWNDLFHMPQVRENWCNMLDDDPLLDLSSYPSGGTYTEALWRTCTCDVWLPRDLVTRARRIKGEDEERVKKELTGGAYGNGINITKVFFISHQGYIGIGPEDTQVGDVMYVLFGGHVPFLLREISEAGEGRGSHTFVGYSYVHGIMDGEILEKEIPNEQVVIV